MGAVLGSVTHSALFDGAADRRALNAGVAIGPILTFVLVSPLLNPIIGMMVWTMMSWRACAVYFGVFFAAMVGGWLMEVCCGQNTLRLPADHPDPVAMRGECSGSGYF